MYLKLISFIMGLNWLKVALVLMALVIGFLSYYVFKLKADGPVEQAMEQVIKDQTGLQIDFSPDK